MQKNYDHGDVRSGQAWSRYTYHLWNLFSCHSFSNLRHSHSHSALLKVTINLPKSSQTFRISFLPIRSYLSNHRQPCLSSELHQAESCHWLAPVYSPLLHSSLDPSLRAPRMLSKPLIGPSLMLLSKELRKEVRPQTALLRFILPSTASLAHMSHSQAPWITANKLD